MLKEILHSISFVPDAQIAQKEYQRLFHEIGDELFGQGTAGPNETTCITRIWMLSIDGTMFSIVTAEEGPPLAITILKDCGDTAGCSPFLHTDMLKFNFGSESRTDDLKGALFAIDPDTQSVVLIQKRPLKGLSGAMLVDRLRDLASFVADFLASASSRAIHYRTDLSHPECALNGAFPIRA
jgi:hypothetical protein